MIGKDKFNDCRWPGANPAIVSYTASAVKIYNASKSIARY
jgi:hypothetical protein